jgi:hypothetical protein
LNLWSCGCFFIFFSWTQVYPLLWLLLLASTYSSVMMLY